MFGRRGVSAVVANVLIILLVVVGVGLLWAAVQPQIKSTGKDIEGDCLSVNLKPLTCFYRIDSPPPNDPTTHVQDPSVNFNVERRSGRGNIKDLKFVVEGKVYDLVTGYSGESRSIVLTGTDASSFLAGGLFTGQNELERKIYPTQPFTTTFNLGGTLGLVPTSVALAGVIDGQKVCPESEPITCECRDDLTIINNDIIQSCPP